MKYLPLLLKAIGTMFFSGGGDPPAEAYWAGNDYLIWIEKEFNVSLDIRFEEPCKENHWGDNYGDVIEKLEETFKK